jgi:hypothetical protein
MVDQKEIKKPAQGEIITVSISKENKPVFKSSIIQTEGEKLTKIEYSNAVVYTELTTEE